MPLRVIAYCRVSTEEQASTGVSLDAQKQKLAAYANLYELEVVEVIEDAGVSAKSLKRPGLRRALDMLRQGKADGIVITKLDRLTRSVRDWQFLIDNYFGEKAGKQLFSVADSIDTRTAAGRLVLNVLLSVAQWERETIAERTKEGLRFKISKNERCGKIRFGYSLADDGKTLTPHDQEQQTINLMRQHRIEGKSFRSIAAELNVRGVQAREGGPWGHSSVRSILAKIQ